MGFSETKVLSLLSGTKRIEVFTGAGMSKDSGLETYRDEETGIWSQVDPLAMASINAWRRDPEPMWAWYRWRAGIAAQAQPHAGHRALSQWAHEDPSRTIHITTQNIDNLHERAGSTEVTHLHGSLFDYRCADCARPWPDDQQYPDSPVLRLTPPPCPYCGGLIRPGVVWFGEPLPARQWAMAEEAMYAADAVIIIGTSGVVYPAAGLPEVAMQRGTPTIEISPQTTEFSNRVDYFWLAKAAEALPALVAALLN